MTGIRRSDREIGGQAGALAVLARCEVIRIGLCAENKPYIVPMNFACEAVDGKVFIYLHCAREGRKLDMIAKNSNVCFEADCSYKTNRADSPCDWSAAYESVIGEGEISVLCDEKEKVCGLDALMKKYGFQGRPGYDPVALEAVTVLRIEADTVTAKHSGHHHVNMTD